MGKIYSGGIKDEGFGLGWEKAGEENFRLMGKTLPELLAGGLSGLEEFGIQGGEMERETKVRVDGKRKEKPK